MKRAIIKACCFVSATICLIGVVFYCTNTAFYADYQTAKWLYVKPKAKQLTDDDTDGIAMNAVDNLNGLECLFIDTDEVEKLLAGNAGDKEDIEELPAKEDNNDQQDMTVEPICVPVVLSVDGSFWYDQYARKMSTCTAMAFFAEHDGYCSKILDMNNDDRYLSRWCRNTRRRYEIERILIPIPSEDQTNKSDDQTITLTVVGDDVCQQAVETIVNDYHPSLETLTELQERSDSPRHIEVLTRMVWNRDTIYGHNSEAAEYLFWNTVALLIDYGKYSIDDINREFKDIGVNTPSMQSAYGAETGAPPVSAPPTDPSSDSPTGEHSMDEPGREHNMDEPLEEPAKAKVEDIVDNCTGQMWDWE